MFIENKNSSIITASSIGMIIPFLMVGKSVGLINKKYIENDWVKTSGTVLSIEYKELGGAYPDYRLEVIYKSLVSYEYLVRD